MSQASYERNQELARHQAKMKRLETKASMQYNRYDIEFLHAIIFITAAIGVLGGFLIGYLIK